MNKHTLFFLYNQASFCGQSTTIAHACMSTNQIYSTHLRGICSAQIQRKFRPQSCGRFANARSRIRKCEHTQTQIQRYTNKVSFELNCSDAYKLGLYRAQYLTSASFR